MTDQGNHPDINTDLLQRIWRAHALGPIREIERTARGSVNLGLIINRRHVIRFNVSGKFAGRFKSEALAYEALKGSGVPVPEVIALDLSQQLSPFDYLITTRLEGTPVIDAWPHLPEGQKRRVARASGELLARVHGHQFRTFGNLRDLDTGGFRRWYDYVQDYFLRYAPQALALEVIDPPLEARLQRALVRHQPLLDKVTRGALVHSDYHFENLLQRGGAVTGVLDFEWALSGDPTWDFIVEHKWEEMCPGSKPYVYEGYTAIRPLDEDHASKVPLYQVLMHLEPKIASKGGADLRQYYREKRAQVLAALASLD